MSRVFVTADLHLGHTKIMDFEPSRRKLGDTIRDHDKEICRRWAETVRSKDVVYILGDVAWNRRALEMIQNLPGYKKLVLGNHDRFDMLAYLHPSSGAFTNTSPDGEPWMVPVDGAFRKVHAYAVLTASDRPKESATGKVLLAHVPVHPASLGKRYLGQIHGHLHSRELRDGRYVNVALEQTDFRPVPFELPLKMIRAARLKGMGANRDW